MGAPCTGCREEVDGQVVSSRLPSRHSPTTVPAVVPVYPPPPLYPGALRPAPMQQHPQASGATWWAQGGQGEELRRAWERIGEEERRLQEREAQEMGEAAGAAEGRAREQGTPGGGEVQAVEELRQA